MKNKKENLKTLPADENIFEKNQLFQNSAALKYRENHFPDLTPLIDVVFILIVFFMLLPLFSEKKIEVELPSASNTSSADNTSIAFEIDKNNNIFFKGSAIKPDDIASILLQHNANKAEKKIVIRSDKNSSFGTIIKVMDIIKNSGYSSLYFSVTEESAQ